MSLGVDLLDLDLGVGLAMALTQTVALLGLVLEDDDLLTLAVFHNGSVHGSALHHGSAELGLVTQDGQDLVELDLVAGLLRQLLDEEDVALGHLVLLTAGLNDCMHWFAPLSFTTGSLSGAKRSGSLKNHWRLLNDPFKAALKL